MMPRRCTICDHEDKARIDAALISGAPLRDIAGQHGVSKSALERHKAGHVPANLAKAKEAGEVARADDLLSQVRHLQDRTLSILTASEYAGELRTALAAIRECRGNLELLAKLLGELDDAPRMNVIVSAEWLTIRTTMMEVLSPYPEARSAVADALLGLEERRD
jgi:transposase-like protein